jgi:hypothetical protein
VLATGPAVLWLLGGRGDDNGPLGPSPQVVPAALHDPVLGPPARPSAASPAVSVAAAPPSPAPPAPPVRIRAVDAGLDAPVVDSGVDERGGMAIPHDIHTVGWYRFGVGPGASTGSAVLAGHVDDHIQGYGAFHRLAHLAVGNPVQVTLTDGRVLTYKVSAVEHVAKALLPAGKIFARDGPPRLTLVTCGGAFDRAVGGYVDNVVVTAAPEPGSSRSPQTGS